MYDSAARLITRHNLQHPNLPSSLLHMWPDHGAGISSALALYCKEDLSLWFCLGYGKIASAVLRITLQPRRLINLHIYYLLMTAAV